MKRIEAIIRPEKLEEIKEALMGINVDGITISQVMGCGKQLGWKEYYRGSEVILNVLPKVKIELFVTDEDLEKTVNTISQYAKTGEVGDGKIIVSTIDDIVRIRTGETEKLPSNKFENANKTSLISRRAAANSGCFPFIRRTR